MACKEVVLEGTKHTEAVSLIHESHFDRSSGRIGVPRVVRVVEPRVDVVVNVEQAHRGRKATVGAADHQDLGGRQLGGV